MRVVVAIALLCVLSACTQVPIGPGKPDSSSGGGASKQPDPSATSMSGVDEVRLDVENGGVTVSGEKDRTTVGLKRRIDDNGNEPKRPTYRLVDGVLTLRGCGDDCAVFYTLRVPADMKVGGTNHNGPVSLSNLTESAIKVRTTNGQIRGRALATDGIDVRSSNGPIDLDVVRAQDVKAHTSNGPITVKVPGGDYRVTASTSNGATDIGVDDSKSAPHALDLTTSNGEITVSAR